MAKTDPVKLEEEKLAHALISRGLLTRAEFEQFQTGADAPPADCSRADLLVRLAKSGLLTDNQARRLGSELHALTRRQIPGYQLLEKLGKGSMGTVYKARQLSMNRLVAIKVLLPRLAANPEYLQRFTREAHLAAKFSSNNVVQAIDVGSAGKIQYFIMEF